MSSLEWSTTLGAYIGGLAGAITGGIVVAVVVIIARGRRRK